MIDALDRRCGWLAALKVGDGVLIDVPGLAADESGAVEHLTPAGRIDVRCDDGRLIRFGWGGRNAAGLHLLPLLSGHALTAACEAAWPVGWAMDRGGMRAKASATVSGWRLFVRRAQPHVWISEVMIGDVTEYAQRGRTVGAAIDAQRAWLNRHAQDRIAEARRVVDLVTDWHDPAGEMAR